MGCDLMERDKNEGAFRQAGVRDFQIGLTDCEIAEEQDVEIEGARAVGDACGAVAAELLLNGEQLLQQLRRLEIRFQHDDGVYKARLGGESNRLRRVERRAGDDAPQGFKTSSCDGECCLGRSGIAGQVRSQSDVGCWHPFQTIAQGRHANWTKRLPDSSNAG